LHIKVDLGAIAAKQTPFAGFRGNSTAMAVPRRLVLRVDSANRNAIGILDDFDKQVFFATSRDAGYASGISGSATGGNFAVGVDHFKGLAGFESGLPMKIVGCEDGPLFGLGLSCATSHKENQRHRDGREHRAN